MVCISIYTYIYIYISLYIYEHICEHNMFAWFLDWFYSSSSLDSSIDFMILFAWFLAWFHDWFFARFLAWFNMDSQKVVRLIPQLILEVNHSTLETDLHAWHFSTLERLGGWLYPMKLCKSDSTLGHVTMHWELGLQVFAQLILKPTSAKRSAMRRSRQVVPKSVETLKIRMDAGSSRSFA